MLAGIIKKGSIVLLGIFLLIILSGVFFYKSEFSIIPYGDTSVLLKQNLLVLLAGLVLTSLSFYLFWKLTEKFNPVNLLKNYWWLLLIFVFLQFTVIYFFKANLTADWEVVYNSAKQIMNGDLISMKKGGYLYAYPNNLGLTIYFILLNLISKNNIFIARLINVLFSIATVIITNKLFILLAPEYKEERGRLFLLSLLFLPAIFMSNLVYNEVISTTFFLAGSYLCVKFADSRDPKTLLLTVLSYIVANFFRGIGPLFVFAALIYFIIKKIEITKIIVFCIFIFIGFSLPLAIVNLKYYTSGKIPEPLGQNSAPITKWIHMGLTDKYFGYWDQGESYWMYARDADGNKVEANKLFIDGIKKKLENYKLNGVVNIYYKKLVWLWTEGTYQSVYLGMSHNAPGGYSEKTPVSDYFNQKIERRDLFKLPMYFSNILALFTILLFISYICIKRKWQLINNESFLFLIFLGFIIFYLLWEVKPRYIYPLYPYILLLTYISFLKLLDIKKINR